VEVKIVINAKNTSKEDIRSFVRMIREWELRTPHATIVGVLFETNPEMTMEEAKEIFEGIFPEFEHLVEIPKGKGQLLRLGTRGVAVEGKLIGTCDELSLSIGEATEEEMQKLQEAQTISLVRIRKG